MKLPNFTFYGGCQGRSRTYLKDCFWLAWENNRDCHITMPLSLKTMEMQIKADRWNKKFRTVQVYWMSIAQREIFKVYAREKNVRAPLGLQILKACSLRKCFNWGSQRCHFLRSPQDISSKENTKENAVVSCLFYPFQGLSVLLQCLRERRKVKQRRHQEVETSVTTAININVLVLVYVQNCKNCNLSSGTPL